MCSVALVEGDHLLAEYSLRNQRAHSRLLMPVIARLIDETGHSRFDLDLIGVSRGPGSFTGLRIGLATAKALAHALEIPLAGVPTLDALAANLSGLPGHEGLVCPVLDARKGEIYAALYRPAGPDMTREGQYQCGRPDLVLAALGRSGPPVTILGDALYSQGKVIENILGDRFRPAPAALAWPRGASVAALARQAWERGQTDDPLALKPMYLRRSEAEVRWEANNQC